VLAARRSGNRLVEKSDESAFGTREQGGRQQAGEADGDQSHARARCTLELGHRLGVLLARYSSRDRRSGGPAQGGVKAISVKPCTISLVFSPVFRVAPTVT
jgi:hypothetical protein